MEQETHRQHFVASSQSWASFGVPRVCLDLTGVSKVIIITADAME